jgi:hypothetical protein
MTSRKRSLCNELIEEQKRSLAISEKNNRLKMEIKWFREVATKAHQVFKQTMHALDCGPGDDNDLRMLAQEIDDVLRS